MIIWIHFELCNWQAASYMNEGDVVLAPVFDGIVWVQEESFARNFRFGILDTALKYIQFHFLIPEDTWCLVSLGRLYIFYLKRGPVFY